MVKGAQRNTVGDSVQAFGMIVGNQMCSLDQFKLDTANGTTISVGLSDGLSKLRATRILIVGYYYPSFCDRNYLYGSNSRACIPMCAHEVL